MFLRHPLPKIDGLRQTVERVPKNACAISARKQARKAIDFLWRTSSTTTGTVSTRQRARIRDLENNNCPHLQKPSGRSALSLLLKTESFGFIQ